MLLRAGKLEQENVESLGFSDVDMQGVIELISSMSA